jgi:hypothetical protein
MGIAYRRFDIGRDVASDRDNAVPMRCDNELVRIRASRAAELAVLQGIERAGGQMFSDFGMGVGQECR